MSKPANWPAGIPYIDESVSHVGVSTLRTLNATKLGGMRGLCVISESGKPLAVLMPYSTYLQMQGEGPRDTGVGTVPHGSPIDRDRLANAVEPDTPVSPKGEGPREGKS